MISVAVIGPGAIGAIVAAWLAQNNAHAVTVCARTPFEALQIETPDGMIHAKPRIIIEPSGANPVDWIVIAVKAYDAAGAARWLPELMGASTRVAALQNGVEHVARFAPYVAAERIVPVIVDIPAERDGPGRVRQRRFGTAIAPDDENGRAFASLFAQTRIAATVTADWTSVAWRKLCINCAGAPSAVTLQPQGVSRRPDIADLMRALIRECVAVGRAEGAQLADDIVEEIVRATQDGPANSVNSIFADRRDGRAMEWDARNGVIARLGAKHGIAAPMNALMASLLSASEAA